jgi:DNA-binding SARP family transcriptional activator
MARLELRLLGAFQVDLDGEPVTRFETDAARGLLAYLALHTGTPFRRETLASLLWPDQPRSEALHALRQTLSRLRRALDDRHADRPLLHVTRQAIHLDSKADYWLDADTFKDAVDATHEHRHRRSEACRPCMERLAQAAELYRGDLLSGFHLDSVPFQEWLVVARERHHRHAMEAFHRLATCHSQRGEYRQAQEYARRQLSLEPWREEAHRQLMLALALGGERSAALAQYESCRSALQRELGIEPEPETVALCEQIRQGTLPADQTPAHNLPAPLTRFVGREAELARIAEHLNDPDYRLVSLVGPGGVGKTRLALVATARATAHYPDGTWFVPLVEVEAEPEEGLDDRIATAIAAATGVHFTGGDDPKAELLEALRPKEMLLVLDNLEHLTGGIGLILELLAQSPLVTVLVTSRARMDVQAERLVQIAGLPVPSEEDPLHEDDCPSVQLFLDRLECAPGESTVDLDRVAQLCRLVDGVPLALELASAWMEHLPLEEMMARLRADIAALPTTVRDVPERHQCLRAVFENSWKLLAETEQHALAQLAVFGGDFSRQAALTIAEVSQAELVGLVHKSLLQQAGSERYALHALVRQFAGEKLAASPAPLEVSDRHGTYYLTFAGERAEVLTGEGPQQAAAEMRAEIANVRQAWSWAMGRIEVDEVAANWIAALVEASRGLSQFYTLEGLVREGEQVFGEAAERVRTVVQAVGETSPLAGEQLAALEALGRLLATQGYFLVCIGDHSSAVTVLQEAETVAKRTVANGADENSVWRALLLVNLGSSHNRLGDYERGKEHLEAGLMMAREAEAQWAEVVALSTLAQAASEQGEYEAAQEHSSRLLELARDLGDRTHMAAALSMLGSIAWRWGDLDQSGERLREALSIHKELGNRTMIPRLLNMLGVLAIMQESFDRAEQYYEEGLTLAHQMGDRQAVADMLNNLGYIKHHFTKNYEEAREHYRESIDISIEIGHRQGATSTLSNLGHLCVLMDEYAIAWDCLREALREAMEMGLTPLTIDALVGVARLRAAVGAEVPAAELLGLALNHPAVEADSAKAAEAVLVGLRERLPADEVEAALERGKAAELEQVVDELLAAD